MRSVTKPYSSSCDDNRDVILSVLKTRLATCRDVLEIGSGTGQHAVYFAQHMPHLRWHSSDCPSYLPGIELWLTEAELDNLSPVIELDVSVRPWSVPEVDAVFSANTLHIMDEQAVKDFFAGVGQLLPAAGKLLIYGPFNYGGKFSSASNESFDRWLKDRDATSGIKHFEWLVSLASENGMVLAEDIEMPVNNRILYFLKG